MASSSISLIRDLSRSTDGIVTTADIIAAGLDPAVAARQVRAGNWQRPARGVYVPSDCSLTGLDLGRVAERLVGTRTVVSGLVVLRELGLRWLPEDDRVLALVDPAVRKASSGRVVLRRTKDLASLQTWRRGGLELAPVARAVVDAARATPRLRDVRGIVLGAVADNWADVDSLDAVLATTQRNGSGLTRRAIEDARRGAASPPEAELVDELIGCGLPFYVNPELWLDGRLLGCTDVYVPGLGIGGEVESVERHGSDDDTETTYDRHERITAPGLELVHLSVRRIRRDVTEAAAHLLRRAYARRCLPVPEPPGIVIRPRGPLLR